MKIDMNHNQQDTGKFGEDVAARYLEEQGFVIVGRNVHISHKEIDLIVENEHYLVFVEVKTRHQDPHIRSPFGRPVDAVDRKKQKNIASAAQIYLYKHPTTKMPRIDVVEVFLSPYATPNNRIQDIVWYQNAFGANS